MRLICHTLIAMNTPAQSTGGHKTSFCTRKYGTLVIAAATANHRNQSMSRTEYDTRSSRFDRCTR
jgi:hypothetical protein